MLLLEWDADRKTWMAREIGPDGIPLHGDAARVTHAPGGACVLLARRGVAANGVVTLPITVLADRDEIGCGGRTYYLASDAVAEPRAFQSRGRKLRCARCQGALVDNVTIVECPKCRARHHESCWHHRESGCQSCGHPARQLAWAPEQLS